ncbi:hypothetical protein CWB99_23075 [Pseudoalteromonas rubra]|uniref:Pycsar effector protein domain-containing protein n=1 Tax=Pseudoalteromonas rubra TaxID=43658 RepID=A0A5S3WGY6_9GAMM|nr:Pycsar system effector family protein [Pseudoalteromonas rubra]TMP23746.1 hypothetical protein CWB99_23075 [Pseudoalteromonas rubra]TMP27243.1 hypothetical protein CWC00_23410 [Pseudoalteromonas rubra]
MEKNLENKKNKSEPDKSDLWDILKRYDSYISTINFKSGLLTTFNMGVFAGVLLKSGELLNVTGAYIYLIPLNLIIIATLCLLGVFFVIQSITPRLSKENSLSVKSVIYFGAVSENSSSQEYANAFNDINEKELTDDLSEQVYEVAKITKSKFELIGKASSFTKCNLCALFVLSVLVVGESAGVKLCLN